MTALLQTYIAERPPRDWQSLFKEATNVGFMVKYQFRESLERAELKFREATQGNKLLRSLLDAALEIYGSAGICDPEQLAQVDFLTNPEQLVALVDRRRQVAISTGNRQMALLCDVTKGWMELMMARKMPPLTPHHTQALTVLMMTSFFEDLSRRKSEVGKKKLQYKTFLAQVATGEVRAATGWSRAAHPLPLAFLFPLRHAPSLLSSRYHDSDCPGPLRHECHLGLCRPHPALCTFRRASQLSLPCSPSSWYGAMGCASTSSRTTRGYSRATCVRAR